MSVLTRIDRDLNFLTSCKVLLDGSEIVGNLKREVRFVVDQAITGCRVELQTESKDSCVKIKVFVFQRDTFEHRTLIECNKVHCLLENIGLARDSNCGDKKYYKHHLYNILD